ncbi:hypothetical protein N7444_005022 [Penicillium canescens]|nr:hypothetical protein N7444_005022 [Penicillium canescens]
MMFLMLPRSALLASLLGNCLANLLTPFGTTASANAIKFQPVIDFDTESCYNTAAVGTNGQVNDGIAPSVAPPPVPTHWLFTSNNTEEDRILPNLRGCREKDRLDHGQVYVRERCNHGWCAYLYGYYFEADLGWLEAHKHDWEHIIVWTLNDNIFFVSWSAHGKYTTHHQSAVLFEGTHAKMVYHLGGVGTHSFRKAEAKDDHVENHTGQWVKSPLVSLEKLDCDIVRKLLNNNWGSAVSDLKKDRFGSQLDKWMPYDARNNEKYNPWEPVVPSWAT